MKFTRIN